MRSFLAVAVREPALGAVRSLLDELAGRVPQRACRWVRGEGVHLTLHFFGQLDESRVGDVLAAVGPAGLVASPFDLTLGGLGSFPPRGAPRVLWLGVSGGSEPLAALAAGCRDALHAAGLAVEDRPFSAHCTLGRPRPMWSSAAGAAWAARAAEGAALPPFHVDRLTLFRSRPGPGGAEYSVVAEVPLGAS